MNNNINVGDGKVPKHAILNLKFSAVTLGKTASETFGYKGRNDATVSNSKDPDLMSIDVTAAKRNHSCKVVFFVRLCSKEYKKSAIQQLCCEVETKPLYAKYKKGKNGIITCLLNHSETIPLYVNSKCSKKQCKSCSNNGEHCVEMNHLIESYLYIIYISIVIIKKGRIKYVGHGFRSLEAVDLIVKRLSIPINNKESNDAVIFFDIRTKDVELSLISGGGNDISGDAEKDFNRVISAFHRNMLLYDFKTDESETESITPMTINIRNLLPPLRRKNKVAKRHRFIDINELTYTPSIDNSGKDMTYVNTTSVNEHGVLNRLPSSVCGASNTTIRRFNTMPNVEEASSTIDVNYSKSMQRSKSVFDIELEDKNYSRAETMSKHSISIDTDVNYEDRHCLIQLHRNWDTVQDHSYVFQPTNELIVNIIESIYATLGFLNCNVIIKTIWVKSDFVYEPLVVNIPTYYHENRDYLPNLISHLSSIKTPNITGIAILFTITNVSNEQYSEIMGNLENMDVKNPTFLLKYVKIQNLDGYKPFDGSVVRKMVKSASYDLSQHIEINRYQEHYEHRFTYFKDYISVDIWNNTIKRILSNNDSIRLIEHRCPTPMQVDHAWEQTMKHVINDIMSNDSPINEAIKFIWPTVGTK